MLAHVSSSNRSHMPSADGRYIAKEMIFNISLQSADRLWGSPVFGTGRHIGDVVGSLLHEHGVAPESMPLPPRLAVSVPLLHSMLILHSGWMRSIAVPVPVQKRRHKRLGLHLIREHIANVDLQSLEDNNPALLCHDKFSPSILQQSADILRTLLPEQMEHMQNDMPHMPDGASNQHI